MDFSESDDIEALRDLLRRFTAREATPEMAAQWDRDDHIPREVMLPNDETFLISWLGAARIGAIAVTLPSLATAPTFSSTLTASTFPSARSRE